MPVQRPSHERVATALAIAAIGLTMMGGSAVYPIVGLVIVIIAAVIAAWPMVVRSTRALDTIGFDYMPGSPEGDPLEQGWTVAYGRTEIRPSFRVVQDPKGRDSLEMTSPPDCAIQHMVHPATAAATSLVRLAIQYSETAMFWLLVQLSSKNGANTVDRQLKIKLQGGSARSPRATPRGTDRTNGLGA